MPKYSMKAPNGKTYDIDGPDGASEEDVRAEIMRRDPTAGDAPKPKSVMGFIGNAVMDGAGIVKSGMQQLGPEGLPAQAIMHPIKSAEAVGDFANNAAHVLTGGMQRLREVSPEAQRGSAPKMDTAAYDKFASGVYDKFGTWGNTGNTIYDKPATAALTIASILNPTLAASGVRGGIAGATARGAKAVGGAVKAKLPAPPSMFDTPPPSVPELKITAKGLYDKAEKAGVVINSQSFANFSDDVRSAMKAEGIDKDLHPKSSAALKRIVDTEGDVSLRDLEILRKIAGDAGGAVDKADKRLARIIVDHVDDYAENLKPHQIVAGNAKKAVGYLKLARENWKNASRGEAIENLIRKARENGGPMKGQLDSAYRTQFKKLANNDRGMARFTPEQQDAIRKVAHGDGPVQSLLHGIGRIIPSSHTGVLTTSGIGAAAHILGAPITGPVGAAVGGVGMGSKIASTMITSKNAQRASELARAGNTPRSAAYLAIQQRRAARAARKGP